MLDWDILQIRSASRAQPIDLLHGPIRLRDVWTPQIGPQRRARTGGYDPQTDVAETMTVTISAPTRDQCARYLDDLTDLLQVQATDFADGLAAQPVLLECRVRGTSSSTYYLILGQDSETQPIAVSAVEGMQEQRNKGWFYPEVVLTFLRRGSAVLGAESNIPLNLLTNAEMRDDGLPWTGVEYGGADIDLSVDNTIGVGTNGYRPLSATLLVTGSQTRYDIRSGDIGAVTAGEVLTLALEVIVPSLLTIPAVAYLQDINSNAIITAEMPFTPVNSDTIFPVPPRIVAFTVTADSDHTRLVIKLDNVTVPGRFFSLAEPVLARGVGAPWRESAHTTPDPTVLRFASGARLQSFVSLSAGPMSPLDFESFPSLLLLAAKSKDHINVIAARTMVNAPLATIVTDAGRITYSGASEVLSLVASPSYSGKAALNLAPSVRRVRVFVVCRATDLNGAYRISATIYGSSDAAYQLPAATTEPHDYLATDLNPHWVYAGEAAFGDTSPKWIRINAERLRDSDALYIDQVIVVAAEDETTAEISMTSIPSYNTLVGVSNVNLLVRYQPILDYRPFVGIENTATGDTVSLHQRGNATIRSVGDQLAVALIGCTGANYVLTSDKNDAPIYLEIGALRYQRLSVPR